jgi:3-phosphoshikimate 1-carboxyvinyltransferase
MGSERGFTPVETPFSASIRPPGSKSSTIRALVMASLAKGRSHLYGALDAADTAAATAIVGHLGAVMDRSSEPWRIDGTGGHLGEPAITLDAGESALSARLALALACLVDGRVTVDGQGRLRERPMAPLLEAMRSQGVAVMSPDGRLPVTIVGRGLLPGGEVAVDATLSSQFITSLLVAAPMSLEPTVVRVEGGPGPGGYVDLTLAMMASFGADARATITGYEVPNTGYRPADIQIEPDVSAAAYPMVAAAITGSRVVVEGVRPSSLQPDIVVSDWLERMGCDVHDEPGGIVVEGPDVLRPIEADMSRAPDGALALAVACLFATGPSRISGLTSWRHKESDRLAAMAEGLGALGAEVESTDDALIIGPGRLHGARLRSHGDHRIAMSLALAGLRLPDVIVMTPQVVDKTWPEFWSALAALTA